MLEKDYNLPLYEILDVLSYISVEEQGLRDFAFIPTPYSSLISVKRPKLDYSDTDCSTVYTNIIPSATDDINCSTVYTNIIPSATFSTISYPLVKASTGTSLFPSAAGSTLTSLLNSRLGYFPSQLYPR